MGSKGSHQIGLLKGSEDLERGVTGTRRHALLQAIVERRPPYEVEVGQRFQARLGALAVLRTPRLSLRKLQILSRALLRALRKACERQLSLRARWWHRASRRNGCRGRGRSAMRHRCRITSRGSPARPRRINFGTSVDTRMNTQQRRGI